MNREKVGKKFRAIRLSTGLRQYEVARLLNWHALSLSNAERGKSCSIERLRDLYDFYDANFHLINEEDTQEHYYAMRNLKDVLFLYD